MNRNRELKERFLAAIRDRRVASAYIIEGAKGLGKLSLARWFAASLCCLSPKEDGERCGRCRVCTQIAEGQFIDVSEIRPESPDKAILVESIRGVVSDVSLLPSEADWRIFIIENSEKMNASAQNALLKSIEEPPAGVVFLLLTEDRQALLPTVISRGVLFRALPLAAEELEKALKERFPSEAPERIAAAAVLAAGSLGKAEEILSGGEMLRLSGQAADYLESVSESSGLGALSVIFPPGNQSRQSLAAFLPLLKLGLRDVLLYQSVKEGFAPRVFEDRERLRRVALGIPPKKAAAMFDRTEELLGRLSLNVNTFAAVSALNLLACSK